MLAVIKTGGKQYLVSLGQTIKVEKLDNLAEASASSRASAKASAKEGSEVTFSEVLLLEKGKSLEIGTPRVQGAKVVGKVLSQGKGKKVIVFKYKPKTRYKVKKGHRQPFTEVEILKIISGSQEQK